jgi:hypothetical protein
VLPTAPFGVAGAEPVAVRVVIAEPAPGGDRTISLAHLACVPAGG